MIIGKYNSVKELMQSNEKFHICLPGGGAAGAIQAGMLCAIYDYYRDKIASITGSSVGALNGAALLFNEGRDKLQDIWMNMESQKVYWRFPSFYSLLRPNPLYKIIEEVISGRIKSSFRCTVVLTKFQDSTKKWIKSDEVSIEYFRQALKASCAIPVLFPAIQIDKSWYVDGGVVNNIPVRPIIYDINSDNEITNNILILHTQSPPIDQPEIKPTIITQLKSIISLLLRANQEDDIRKIKYLNELNDEYPDKSNINLNVVYPEMNLGTFQFVKEDCRAGFLLGYNSIYSNNKEV
ncbi:MAG: patatin-like phospholipase family protein [archaeon]